MQGSKRRLFRIAVLPHEQGERIDQVIPRHAPELSRTVTRKIIDIGGVHLNGRRLRRCSSVVNEADEIEVHLDGRELDPFRLGDAHILFRDHYLLAIDKPAGIDTQPTPARFKGTLYEALQKLLANPSRPLEKPSLGMVQRLDRDTSGVLVFSIHPRSHGPLTKALSGREVEKVYLALVQGVPSQAEGEIRSFLARSRRDNRMKSVEKGGKEAITRFRVRESFRNSALLEVKILTGRSHQIRVHLAESGHPLIGDTLYGGEMEAEGMTVSRQMLHSWRLGLRHPVSGEPLRLEAPLPEDMECLMQKLRNASENEE